MTLVKAIANGQERRVHAHIAFELDLFVIAPPVQNALPGDIYAMRTRREHTLCNLHQLAVSPGEPYPPPQVNRF